MNDLWNDCDNINGKCYYENVIYVVSFCINLPKLSLLLLVVVVLLCLKVV